MATQEIKNLPVHTCHCGNVKATIWKNDGSKRLFYSMQLSHLFKNTAGNLRNSDSFNVHDLSAVRTALDAAQAWIEEHPL